MYLGKIVETAPADQLYANPVHPYTTALLSAVPIPDPKENAAREPLVLEGDVPSPIDPPPACRFHTRCPWATEICSRSSRRWPTTATGRIAACHHPRNVSDEQVAAARIVPQSPQTASDGAALARAGRPPERGDHGRRDRRHPLARGRDRAARRRLRRAAALGAT